MKWSGKATKGSVCYTGISVFLLVLSFPSLASAQAYVPVRDVDLNPAFTTYSNNFDTYANNFDQSINTNSSQDSLREIISSGDPGGIAKQACKKGPNALAAFAYTTGPWNSASASSSAIGSTLPKNIPSSGNVQINTSGSLRCLLQEVVEWQKLGLSLQIHSLLKTYISDAQTKQLNNQLLSQIAATNLKWGKAGNTIVNNGVISSEAVYNTNVTQNIYNVQGREFDNIIDQASADPAVPNAVGSLGLCDPWRLDTTANMARNNRGEVEDPSGTLDRQGTTCKLGPYIKPTDYSKYGESFNNPASGQGGMTTFLSTLYNPGNSPLGAQVATDFAVHGRLGRQKETTLLESQSSGFRPTKECSGLANDPYCRDKNSIAITPAGQNQANIQRQAASGDQQVENANTVDAKGGPPAELASVNINTKAGLLGYDETALATSKTVVNNLVQEFYDVIDIGYFGLKDDTFDWAQATMLMVYDEMKFDDSSTETVVTAGTAPVKTGY